MKTYAVVKDSLVTNMIIFEDNVTEELIEHFKNIDDADELVLADGHPAAAIDGTWDGTKFTTKDGLVNEDWDLSNMPNEILTHLRTMLDS